MNDRHTLSSIHCHINTRVCQKWTETRKQLQHILGILWFKSNVIGLFTNKENNNMQNNSGTGTHHSYFLLTLQEARFSINKLARCSSIASTFPSSDNYVVSWRMPWRCTALCLCNGSFWHRPMWWQKYHWRELWRKSSHNSWKVAPSFGFCKVW